MVPVRNVISPKIVKDEFWQERSSAFERLKPIWTELNETAYLLPIAHLKENELYRLCYVMDPWVAFECRELIRKICGDCEDYRIYEFDVRLHAWPRPSDPSWAGFQFLVDIDGAQYGMELSLRNYGMSWRLYAGR